MDIDLLKLNYSKEINVDEDVIIPKDLYDNTDILELKNVHVSGKITIDMDNNYLVNMDLYGTMMLHDSLTYDVIPYDFKVKIEETLENSLKTLDLISFLWHYIVLEVPLRFTISEGNYIKTDNYQVISEEEYSRKNNPFSDFHIE